LWAIALVAAAAGWAIHQYGGHHGPILVAVLVLGPYGILYLGGTWIAGLAESRAIFGRFLGASRTPR
ncbi:MAG: hypothetical protein WCC76_04230, partial [Candidatus Acidiferrales bacterium]